MPTKQEENKNNNSLWKKQLIKTQTLELTTKGRSL